VGSYVPNILGLFDVHGNVHEWCDDHLEAGDTNRNFRGGGWDSLFEDWRAANHSGNPRPHRVNSLGLRLARVPAGAPSPEVKSPSPAVAPFSDADVQRIAALPAAEQVEEVRKELIRRNPGFDGTMQHKIENDVVTDLRVVTDQVTDIGPIRIFKTLRALDCSGTHVNFKGNGQLADLAPLTGMNWAALNDLNLNFTMVGDAGLVHFKDCTNLTGLHLYSTHVSDAGLAYLKNCTNLMHLNLGGTKASDAGLAHFKDCKKLTQLYLSEASVGDAGLGYFKECENLTVLGLGRTQVTDVGLAHFKNCNKLQDLNLLGTSVGNAGLAHFKDCKELTRLSIGETKVTDLSLLKGMPLKELYCDFQPERDAEILRSIKTLTQINGIPAAEFWERYDKGEFKE
jgi:Leucine-rich repeat (LRR) protein